MYSSERPGCRRRNAGFSMVELLVTLAIAGILLAAAGPSFVSMLYNDRITAQVNLLLADVHLARLEAIKHNQDVVLCRSRNGRHCTRSSGHHADWSMGWIIYLNPDADKKRDPGEPLLRVRNRLREGMSLYFNQWWRVSYHGDGSAKNGTFTLCDGRGPDHARALTLYYTGRPRISDTRADGDPLECGA